ncbi:MAG: topoisomerase IV [Oscillospiraceae bacterium]|nr:topoisomerase IV [Oscillospiraceae bacterium]
MNEPLTKILETNYMPYAMSVILSRAIPEIDGFKPSHRKLLYTMYKMGLQTGHRTKSANVVGQTMRLNPHGDAAIYDTLVRLSRGNESLLNPFVDSKGNFGKVYSRDMACAAARYTEVKLSEICEYAFESIDKNTVNFMDNYDSTMKEPALLPVAFPNILANPNLGIAVGMASSICSFNLAEVCETTIALLKDPNHDLSLTLLAPDFSTGGAIIYSKAVFDNIYATGKGSFKVRSIYTYAADANRLLVTEIPPTTTVEAIIDKIIEHIKDGRLKEIADVRDETDLAGLRIAIDLKKGINPENLMSKLFKLTPLEDSFACNFNLLVGASPQTLGVREIIQAWLQFRKTCVRRELGFELDQMATKRNLLLGLQTILLDIDKAIKTIRNTKLDSRVIPNLMKEFGLNQAQAEFVAQIRLRNLNKEYILKKTEEIQRLNERIKWAKTALGSEKEIDKLITLKLREVSQKHGKPRLSKILNKDDLKEPAKEEVKDYPVQIFVTKEGYIKKVLQAWLNGEVNHKLKQNDKINQAFTASNLCDLLIFTTTAQVYKLKCSELDLVKPAALGEFLPAKLTMTNGELPIYAMATINYSGNLILAFENGKFAKVATKAYNMISRRKMSKAFNLGSPLVFIDTIAEDTNYIVSSKKKKLLVFNTALLNCKVTRDTRGMQVMKLAAGDRLAKVKKADQKQKELFQVSTIPRAGFIQNNLKQLEMGLS